MCTDRFIGRALAMSHGRGLGADKQIFSIVRRTDKRPMRV